MNWGIVNLRTDPFEFADVTSNTYYDWFLHRDYILFLGYAIADKWAATKRRSHRKNNW